MLKTIQHSFPLIGNAEKNALNKVLNTSFLAQGREVEKFEKGVSEYVGCFHAQAVNSGTAALHLALLALDIKAGDEVIIPNYVCRSVLNAVQYARARPVLCDVDKRTFNILPAALKSKINKRAKAVIVAHMFGFPAQMDELKKIRIPIIEDCAQSIGADFKGKLVGSFGDLSIFSFEGTKTITTGEGGMILTNSQKLSNKITRFKEPYEKDQMPKYTFRMSDLQAAIGRVQLKKLPGFIFRRRKIAQIYRKAFKNLKVDLPFENDNMIHSYHRFIISLKKKNQINKVINYCQKKRVMVKRPIKHYALNQYLGISNKLFPNTDFIMKHCISIPIYPALSEAEIMRIIKVVKDGVSQL
ncbi:MAG: DegT/DnrJ/EryC1/StrS aminotransferase family protein [Candidatus Omnitrophota bacterium]